MTNEPLNAAKAVSVLGSASIVNLAAGLLKMKVAATLLGPTGVGLIGLFQQVMTTVSTLFSLGLQQSGTRQIADKKTNGTYIELFTARRALFISTAVLAVLGGLFIYLAQDVLFNHFLEVTLEAAETAALAFGVAFTIGAGSQQALLNGYRNVKALALLSILIGGISSSIAIVALIFFREFAILIFVIASPVVSFALGYFFVNRLPKGKFSEVSSAQVTRDVQKLVYLGVPIMLATLVVAAANLIIRNVIQRDLGLEFLGLFTAVWLISQYYVGFLYSALSMDFYARLTGALPQEKEALNIINMQTELGLLFATPLFIGLIALAPYALWILYSAEFVSAANLLVWFVIGDIFKILGQPLLFTLMAAGAVKSYFFVRFFGALIFVILTILLVPYLGLSGVGLAYIAMNIFCVPVQIILVRKLIPIAWSPSVILLCCLLLLAVSCVTILGIVSVLAAAVLGSIFALIATVVCFQRVRYISR